MNDKENQFHPLFFYVSENAGIRLNKRHVFD